MTALQRSLLLVGALLLAQTATTLHDLEHDTVDPGQCVFCQTNGLSAAGISPTVFGGLHEAGDRLTGPAELRAAKGTHPVAPFLSRAPPPGRR